MDKKRSEGFTLVELLLVVVILVVLAAIAVPIFLNQSAKAKDAAAQSNLAAIGSILANGASIDSSQTTATYTGDIVTVTSPNVGNMTVNDGGATVNLAALNDWCLSQEGGTSWFYLDQSMTRPAPGTDADCGGATTGGGSGTYWVNVDASTYDSSLQPTPLWSSHPTITVTGDMASGMSMSWSLQFTPSNQRTVHQYCQSVQWGGTGSVSPVTGSLVGSVNGNENAINDSFSCLPGSSPMLAVWENGFWTSESNKRAYYNVRSDANLPCANCMSDMVWPGNFADISRCTYDPVYDCGGLWGGNPTITVTGDTLSWSVGATTSNQRTIQVYCLPAYATRPETYSISGYGVGSTSGSESATSGSASCAGYPLRYPALRVWESGFNWSAPNREIVFHWVGP